MKCKIVNWIYKKNEGFFSDLFFSVIILIVATFFSAMIVKGTGANNNVISIYMLAIIFISLKTSRYMWGIVSSIIGVIGANYIFTYPYFRLNFTISGYPLMFLSMFLVSIITSTMTTNIKKQMEQARAREQKTHQLYEISQRLLLAKGKDSIVEITIECLKHFTDSTVVFYMYPVKNIEEVRETTKNINRNINYDIELKEINRSFDSQDMTGISKENDSKSKFLYIPVISNGQVFGVIGLECGRRDVFDDEMLNFIRLILSQIAMALEKQSIIDEQQIIELEAEKEKMRGNLLRAISHDLRTPLTGILGASAAIKENGDRIDKCSHDKLIEDIHEDASWLLHMVENLLSVTKISDDKPNLKKEPEAVEEVIAEAAKRIKKRFPIAKLKIKVPDEFIMAPMDATLICQVLINLIENAIKYGDKSKYIDITASVDNNNAVFEVRDRGKGISKDEMPVLFEGFASRNHKNNDTSRGLGIGLSICKSVVVAHGGEIKGENSKMGGAIFTFTLPMEDEK
ncbi:MAG: ATP-binding protein [Clostridium sp.]|nr:ATP-binding protein [Clostridium sp.]